MKEYSIQQIDYHMTKAWILKRHYAKRMPSISHAFGLFKNKVLVGVVAYGSPASPHLCMSICGEEWRLKVLELNRLVLLKNKKNEASFLVGNTLKLLPKPSIVVSYADTKMNHIGYVYQATNWLYTGCTTAKSDIFSSSGHSRHHDGDPTKRQPRSAKHRYLFFVGNKRQKKEMRKLLRYKIAPYPKGTSLNYDTGDIEASQTILFTNTIQPIKRKDKNLQKEKVNSDSSNLSDTIQTTLF